MTAAAANWLRQTKRTYFGNAAAQRDFRVQLRGNRSLLLFGSYLAILIVVAYFKYGEIESDVSISVVQAQRQLRDFYTLIVMMLAGMVAIVTPGLAATTIVLERQRRSLDLVFSAPVPPRYYLVGKIIAVYRYIWMLLILSLPVTAACVVLGGASWSDVLTVYFLLSIHGLLFAAIGLMMSTICAKPVAAVVWTYAGVGGYLAASGAAAASSYAMFAFRSGMGTMSGGAAPFVIGINPFSAVYAMGTYTEMWSYHVPNYLLSALAILVVVRLCLLGAGSLLSDGRETANLRIHWIVVTALVAYGMSYWMASSGALRLISSSPGPAPGATPLITDPVTSWTGMLIFWLLSPLLFVLPTLSSYGKDGYLRQRQNGWFGVRNMLDGTPAGTLPFLLTLVVASAGLGLVGLKMGGSNLPSVWFLGYVAYVLGFWALFWAIGRAASSYDVGIRTARTIVVAAFVVLVVLPVPFLSAIAADSAFQSDFSAWDLYILRPVTQANLTKPMIYGFGLLFVALALNFWSEHNRARRETIRA